MRLYGKIETGFWTNPKVKKLGQDARILLVYLYTSPHSSAFGCYVLPAGYIQADMEWTIDRVSDAVSELSREGFLKIDESTNLIWIRGWWGHNTIDNNKHAIGVARQINMLPKCELRNEFIAHLLACDTLMDTVRDTISDTLCHTVSEGSAIPSRYIEKKKEKNKNKKKNNARADMALAGFDSWYEAYPRHVGRGQALKAYDTALKKTDHATLMAGARSAQNRFSETDKQFIPYPATWLNGERWLDEETPAPSNRKRAGTDDEIYRGVI